MGPRADSTLACVARPGWTRLLTEEMRVRRFVEESLPEHQGSTDVERTGFGKTQGKGRQRKGKTDTKHQGSIFCSLPVLSCARQLQSSWNREFSPKALCTSAGG